MRPTGKDTSTDKKERSCCKMLRRISVLLWTLLGQHTHCALCYFHCRSTIKFNSIHSGFPFSFSPHFNISSFILLDLVLSLCVFLLLQPPTIILHRKTGRELPWAVITGFYWTHYVCDCLWISPDIGFSAVLLNCPHNTAHWK